MSTGHRQVLHAVRRDILPSSLRPVLKGVQGRAEKNGKTEQDLPCMAGAAVRFRGAGRGDQISFLFVFGRHSVACKR